MLVAADDGAGCYTKTLSFGELENYRQRFPAFLDADQFSIQSAELQDDS